MQLFANLRVQLQAILLLLQAIRAELQAIKDLLDQIHQQPNPGVRFKVGSAQRKE